MVQSRLAVLALLATCSSGALATGWIFTGADAGAGPHVKAFEASTANEIRSFFAYTPSFTGGVRVAAGDVDADGIPDIVTGTGPGSAGHVKVFSGSTGAEIRSFLAYGPSYTGGVHVASGDIDGDGASDIITGTSSTTHVKAFSGLTGAEIRSFFAFTASIPGVTVGAGDVTGDGTADIIVGTASGSTQVRAFHGLTSAVVKDFIAYSGSTEGVFVAGGDVTGDGLDDIVTGLGSGAAPHVKVFDGFTGTTSHSFLAYSSGFAGGVRVAAGDVNGDGFAEIVTGSGPGSPAHVKVFDRMLTERQSFLPYSTFNGGVFVAATSVVPEPATVAALSLGLAYLARRRASKKP